MEYYKIVVWMNSPADGSAVCDGVTYSTMLPRVGEYIKWNGDCCAVTKIVYDYDDADEERAVNIYVVPAS